MFEGSQPDPPNYHIVGGQIAAQALLAARKTVAGWAAAQPAPVLAEARRRSVSVYFDASGLRDGGTFFARRVTAALEGEILMKAIASFTASVDNVDYQDGMPDAPAPETPVGGSSSS